MQPKSNFLNYFNFWLFREMLYSKNKNSTAETTMTKHQFGTEKFLHSWQKKTAVGAGVFLLILTVLALSNPSLATYHTAIVKPRAALIAENWAETDRRTIEQEAARAAANYASNRNEMPSLTALSLLKTIPYLPSYLERTKETEGRAFPERLAMWKHQALLRVSEAHDTTVQGVLADLIFHTTRASSGVVSIFSTCYEGKARRYVGLVGWFIELAEEACSPGGTK